MSPLPAPIQTTLYGLARLPLRPAAELWAAWKGTRGAEARLEARQRRGLALPEPGERPIWLHGASLGEARLMATLTSRLAERLPDRAVVTTAMTPVGWQEQRDSGLPGAFVPLDLRAYVERVFAAWGPALFAAVETELWPQLFAAARRHDVPALLLNARLAERRMARYLRWSAIYRPIVGGLRRIGARSAADAERFVRLGAPERRLLVTGDVKFDAALPEVDTAALSRRLGLADDDELIVAGSTREGEERTLVAALERLRRDRPRLRMALAPRHLGRVEAITGEIERGGLRCARWSESDGSTEAEVVVVDAFGVLAGLYAVADVAFVGGTLAPIGGHNVLEPAALGIPVVVGPHTAGIAETLDELIAAGAARRVADAAGLEAALGEWLASPEQRRQSGAAGRAVVERHRGATERSTALVVETLAGDER